MSLFESENATCPACKGRVEYEMVHSVNADRRPDLRDEILSNAFQRLKCPECGEQFRIEPQFSYVHMAGKQYLAAWPVSRMLEWAALEKHADDTFQKFYGAEASPAAQQIGREFVRRTVFGWHALREKIVSASLGLDDVTLELAKIALQRWAPEGEGHLATELRLLGVSEGHELLFGEFEPGSEQAAAFVRAPRDLLAEIDADAEGWQELRERLMESRFVDAQRLQMTPTPA